MCAQQMSPVDDSLHLRESIIGGSLILNARSIQFEQKKSFSRTYYAVFFLFFFLQTRRENSIPSLRQWIEYVGSASERRMDSYTTAPTSCMAWARHDRRLASRYYDVLENTSSLAFSRSRFFFLGSNLEGRNSRETFATRRLINNTYHISSCPRGRSYSTWLSLDYKFPDANRNLSFGERSVFVYRIVFFVINYIRILYIIYYLLRIFNRK